MTPQLSKLIHAARAAVAASFAAGSFPNGDDYALMSIDYLDSTIREVEHEAGIAHVEECSLKNSNDESDLPEVAF